MRWRTIKVFLLFCTLGFVNIGYSQQIDPALASAVAISGGAEVNALKNTKKAQENIAFYQAAITLQMDRIRSVEQEVYGYLQNASGAIKNAIEIKQAGVLTTEIYTLFGELRQSAQNNPQGMLMLPVVSKQITKATEEMIGIYSYISSISLSSDVLLNAVERNQITWTVLYKLRQIKSTLYLLKFQIDNYTLADLPRILFPMEYFYATDGKRIADQIIASFSK